MSKVIVRVIGGIGNQLFSYAAARRLAIINDAELVIDSVSGFERDRYGRVYQLDHFYIPCRKATPRERLQPLSRVRRGLKKKINSRRPFESRTYIQQEYIDYDARLLNVKVRGGVYIEGYWQSERYFKDIEDIIRRDLRIIPPLDQANISIAEKIRSQPSVSVHVRFFDASYGVKSDNAPLDYYARAIKKMEDGNTGLHYFIFSDQTRLIKRHIPLPESRFTIVGHNKGEASAYADLWLMSQCDNFIIANSTFSWWAAWLSEHPHKVVIAPGFEKRNGKMWWGFDGLLPDEWIRL